MELIIKCRTFRSSVPAPRRASGMKHLARITTLFAIVGLSFSPGPRTRAQEASQKLTALDEFQFQLPVDPQISPDGKKIVYVRRFADPATDRRYSNLWIINADGTDHRALTTGNHNDASPPWSPDGKMLSFSALVPGKGPHLADLPAPPFRC